MTQYKGVNLSNQDLQGYLQQINNRIETNRGDTLKQTTTYRDDEPTLILDKAPKLAEQTIPVGAFLRE